MAMNEQEITQPAICDGDVKGEPQNCDAPAFGRDALARRRLIMGGMAAGCAIVSVRPALAQTAASVLNCQIPVPDAARGGSMIAADGSVVPAGTQGAFPGAPVPFRGEDVKNALRSGRTLPGTSYEQSRAYINYIRRLQSGTSGFTCYASIQLPR